MKVLHQFRAFSFLGMATLPLALMAAEPANMTIDQISACMRANIVERGSLRDFGITAVDREGKSTALKVKAFWKPTKNKADERMTLQVIEPETFAGTSYLIVGDAEEQKISMYLPALKRVQTVSGGEATMTLWGTDFTIADVKQVQGVLIDGNTQRQADAQVSGRAAYVLDTTTSEDETGYTHVKSYVDQESCTLLKSELFTSDGDPAKTLEADLSTLLEVEPYWVMLGYTMTDLRNGTHTDLKLGDVFLLENLPESLFTTEGFHTPQE